MSKTTLDVAVITVLHQKILEIFLEIPQDAIPSLDDSPLGDTDPPAILSGGYPVKE